MPQLRFVDHSVELENIPEPKRDFKEDQVYVVKEIMEVTVL